MWSLYIVDELCRLGSIARTLQFDIDDQDPDVHLSASIPAHFRGSVLMAAPRLCVEVSVRKNASSDDDDDDDDAGRTADLSSSDDEGRQLLILLTFLVVSPCKMVCE